ncbi:MAG TPA: metallophosphoesterase [Armatimonadota bacterium]|jgi:hypothetical protein
MILQNIRALLGGAGLILCLFATNASAQGLISLSWFQPTTLDSSAAWMVSAQGQYTYFPPAASLEAGDTLQWRVQVPVSGYYDVSLTLGPLQASWGLRAEVMLDNRVLGVVYNPPQTLEPVESDLGRLRLEAGQYLLRVRNPYRPVGEFGSLTFSPTDVPFALPRSTFCTVQDWHLDPPLPIGAHLYAGGNYNAYLSPADTLLGAHQTLESLASLSPDFLVGNGDLVHWGSVESLSTFADLMSSLPLPWFVTMGHHETKTIDRATIKQAWKPGLPRAATYYGLDLNGTRYLFLDSAYFQGPDGRFYRTPPARWTGKVGLCAEEWPWLRGVLLDNQRHYNLPVVVFTHHTIIPYRLPLPPPVARRLDDYKTMPPADAPELLALLNADPNVKAIFSGHAHFQMAITSGHILHMQGAATGEGAMTYLRGLVFDDHLEVETYQAVDQSFLQESYAPLHTGDWVVGYPEDINCSIGF